MRVLHAGDPRARWRPPRRRARPAGSISIARSPRTCAAAPAGRRSTRPSKARGHADARARDLGAAARRAGARRRRVRSSWAPTSRSATGGFADDGAPRDALVAVPLPPGSTATAVEAAGHVVGRRRVAARGTARSRARCRADARRSIRYRRSRRLRRSTGRRAARARRGSSPRTSSPTRRGASRAATRRRRSPTAARSAARSHRRSRAAARELADRTGRAVRVVYSREDVVRLGPKRPPIAATACFDGATVRVRGVVVGDADAFTAPIAWPYAIDGRRRRGRARPSPARRPRRRCAPTGLAERAVLLEGALARRRRRPAVAGARRPRRVGAPRHVRRGRQRRASPVRA